MMQARAQDQVVQGVRVGQTLEQQIADAIMRDEQTKAERIRSWYTQGDEMRLRAEALRSIDVSYHTLLDEWRITVYPGSFTGVRSFKLLDGWRGQGSQRCAKKRDELRTAMIKMALKAREEKRDIKLADVQAAIEAFSAADAPKIIL